MKIPGLGILTEPDDLGWRYSDPIKMGALGGKKCCFVLEGYDDDPKKEDFHAAIANFLAADESVLKAAEPRIFRYYEDCNAHWEPDDDEHIVIAQPGDVWGHIRLGDEPMVTRRAYGDRLVYISLECGCDWEPEHGLQIVFKCGLWVNKVGSYNGHLTNSDAYGGGNDS